LSSSGVVAVIVLATIEGALVALPRADALEPLRRLRSPAWAALLPGSILLGTLGPLALPSIAFGLVVLAAVATPLLAVVAIVGVVRGPRAAPVGVALSLTVAAALVSGWLGQASDSFITALGCLALGAALVRLIPRRWILIGVMCMCAVDVVLLISGAGESAATVMSIATTHVRAPAFDQAALGPIATDYPDLVLAALLGALLAGHQYQGRAAVLVTALAGASGMFLPLVGWLPATVPLTVAFIVFWLERFSQPRRASVLQRRASVLERRASELPGRASSVATRTAAAHEAAA
jgi:hypothetical protein